MIKEHCAAIIGFEYLSDLLLVEKIQKNYEIPIFTSYASLNQGDSISKNIFIFMPTYDFHVRAMMKFLDKKFKKISNILIVTEVDRPDLIKYKFAYEKIFLNRNIHYDTLDFVGSDIQFENNLKKLIKIKKYRFVFLLSSAVGSTKIINQMNSYDTIFIGTENFGSSTNQSLYVRLDNKKVNAFSARNIDFIKKSNNIENFRIQYIKKYASIPSPLSVYTYDAMMIILNALKNNDILTSSNILETNYTGVSGAYIRNCKFYRSNQYVILSIHSKGFVCEE